MTPEAENPVTRRELLGILEGADQAPAPPGDLRLIAPAGDNPINKYPKPPFKPQSQPWPGLTGKMEPRPDHGEESYRGSNRLLGRKALITGGDLAWVAPPRSHSRGKAPTWRSLSAGRGTRRARGDRVD